MPREYNIEIAAVAQRLEQALERAQDERANLRAVIDATLRYRDGETPSIEEVEALLRSTTPWDNAANGDLLRCVAYYVCCAIEGVLVLPSHGQRIEEYLFGAISLLGDIREEEIR
jgi:hypothetical protein